MASRSEDGVVHPEYLVETDWLEQHLGTGGGVYGRVGRVASSVNVPAASLRNPNDGTYLPASQLRKSFDAVNVADADRIIVY